MSGELFDGLNAERTKGALRDFADAGNFANGQRSEETRFHSWRNPDQAARFGLIGRNFRNQTGGSQSAGARQAGLPRDGA